MSRSKDYEEVWVRHRRALLGYLVRNCDDREDAADLLAETFLVVWRRMSDLPAGPHERAWMYGVARRVLANHRRGVRRRLRLADAWRAELGELSVPAPGEEALAVRAALAELSADDRDVLTLAAWEGLSTSEIAEVMGLSPSAVTTRQSRARTRLRTHLAGQAVSVP